MEEETRKLKKELAMLEDEHRSLDRRISDRTNGNMLEIQRLKKQKLALRDRISEIQGMLNPDIIA